MTRRAYISLLALALIALTAPVAARTLPLAGENNDAASCPEEVGAATSTGDSATSPPAAKRSIPASPAKNKAGTTYRGSNSPARAPRWHRFLPGMYR